MSSYYREYYQKNKETIHEQQKEWRRKNRKQVNEWNKKWRDSNKEYYHQRTKDRRDSHRIQAREYLGGKCVGCGTTENLQFDHIDRNLKEFNIAHKLDCKWETIKEELDKCQLLCYDCHILKSTINHDREKLAEGYRVSSVEHLEDKIIVVLEKI